MLTFANENAKVLRNVQRRVWLLSSYLALQHLFIEVIYELVFDIECLHQLSDVPIATIFLKEPNLFVKPI